MAIIDLLPPFKLKDQNSLAHKNPIQSSRKNPQTDTHISCHLKLDVSKNISSRCDLTRHSIIYFPFQSKNFLFSKIYSSIFNLHSFTWILAISYEILLSVSCLLGKFHCPTCQEFRLHPSHQQPSTTHKLFGCFKT